MLALSRRPHQSIVFPTLGLSIQILRVAGQTVRLGVNAPRSIPILREELQESNNSSPRKPSYTGLFDEAARQARHRLRGRLNTATIALSLAQRQLQAGLTMDANDTLQQALAELEKLEAESVSASIPSQTDRSGRCIRTLLVEDNPYESALLESYLRLNGMEVANASDGQEALDYLANHESPDAVLLDMHMPRCDGPTTVAAIRRNPNYRSLKLIAISGSKPTELERLIGPATVDGWFTKPLDPARLVEALTTVAAAA